MINHSIEYNIAFIGSMLEFWIECWVFDKTFKTNQITLIIGIIFSVVGHIFRIGAFLNAKSNF